MKTFQFFGNVNRAREVLSTLAVHGFGEVLSKLELPTGFLIRGGPSKGRVGERLRRICEELGPTFVKIGQVLSTRPDLVGREIARDLQGLRDQASAPDFSTLKPILEKELGSSLSELFSEFDETPKAAGSLGIVFKATFLSGKQAAIKLRRPGIQRQMSHDLDILSWLAHQMEERVSDLRKYQFPQAIKEIRQSVLNELDFGKEAAHQELFHQISSPGSPLIAPEVFPEWTTRSLIVMEWMEGRAVSALPPNPEKPAMDLNALDKVARQLIFDLFDEGFFHADPHGGNVLLSNDGRLIALDWGMCGHLGMGERWLLGELLWALLHKDAARFSALALWLPGMEDAEPGNDWERRLLHVLRVPSGEEENFSSQLIRVSLLLAEAGAQIGSNYSLVTKALCAFEDTALTLNPHFDLRKSLRRHLGSNRRSFSAWKKRSERMALGGLGQLRQWSRFPRVLNKALNQFAKNELSVQLRLQGLEEIHQFFSAAVNRLVLAIIIGALVIGSSIVITTGVKPLLFGYPMIGLLGYLISAILGFAVVFFILRGK